MITYVHNNMLVRESEIELLVSSVFRCVQVLLLLLEGDVKPWTCQLGKARTSGVIAFQMRSRRRLIVL